MNNLGYMQWSNSSLPSALLYLQMRCQKERLLLVFAIVLSCNLTCTVAFNFPKFDDIKDIFSELANKFKSGEASEGSNEHEVSSSTDHERLRRQVSNIGDESPNPYEITSSR